MHVDTRELMEELVKKSTGVEKEFNRKEHANKGYSFPRYIRKYNGFSPQGQQPLTPKITGKDIRRIIGLNSEHVHNYFMEYQKSQFFSLRICNFKVIERIYFYFETSSTPFSKETSSGFLTSSSKSNEKENHKNSSTRTSSEQPSPGEGRVSPEGLFPFPTGRVEWEVKDCHLKLKENDKSSFLKPTETNFHTQVDEKYKIDLKGVTSGKDRRTTCMIKNIPNKYTQKMLIDLLNEHHFGCYDFVYLRMDFKNKCNVGYAFVNLIDPLCINSLYKKINHKGWKKFSSNKIAQLTYASIQGLENLKKKFRKSSVMQEQESYRPKLFYSEGPLKGYEQTEFYDTPYRFKFKRV